LLGICSMRCPRSTPTNTLLWFCHSTQEERRPHCGQGISLPAIAAALTNTMSNLRAKAKWRFGSMLLTATNNVVATTQMLKT
jgi:hypothetical protein